MRFVLIGEESAKRTDFMKQAASSQGIPLDVLSWTDLQKCPLRQLQKAVVKIDPPAFSTVCLGQMRTQVAEYIHMLQELEQAECTFLNSPEAIIQLLDKKQTKERLQQHGIPVTQMFPEEIQNVEQLLEVMQEQRCFAVFIKPRYFSGAAGAVAFRIHPVRGEMALYTSCRMEGRQLINTKKLFHLQSRQEICSLLNELLSMECVTERWHPKADAGGRSCDLRAVYQFGHIAHITVRCSKGPITNLHLNNQAMEIEALGFNHQAIQELEDLCGRAVLLFPGLAMAGIDILLEKGTLRPRIIEMNGQGDLIYQDIYRENRIYREQVEVLCRQSI